MLKRMRVNKQAMRGAPTALVVRSLAESKLTRKEKLNGVEHLVVPVVALVEGVLHPGNAEFPELALADEFGRFPQGWDGRPVVLNHPKKDGEFVPANSPDIVETQVFGQLFNTVLDGKKLKTEAWINLDRVEKLSEENPEIKEIVTALENGDETIEVSTGLMAQVSPVDGVFGGEEFSGIWTNIVPDHLALLSKGTKGACSVEDGCGAPRINQEKPMKANCTCQDQELKGLKGLFARMGKLLQFKGAEDASSQSDSDRFQALNAALKASGSQSHWIVAVFKDHFVYEPNFMGGLVSREFSIDENGVITLGDETTPVRPVTDFVPVRVSSKEDDMKPNAAAAPAADPAAPAADPKVNAQPQTPAQPQEPAAPAAAPSAAASPATPSEPKVLSTEEFIKQAPEGVREVLQEGMRMQAEKKASLIKGLMDTKRCKFTEDELKKMDIRSLENLSALAEVPDYSGQAPVRANASGNDDEIPAPPALFPVKASA